MSWEDWENGEYIGDEPYYGDDSDEEWGEYHENKKKEISYYLNIFKDVITTNKRIEIWYGRVIEEFKESTFENVAREISSRRYEIRTPFINQKRIILNADRISFETRKNKTDNNREFSLSNWSLDEIRRFFGGDWHDCCNQRETSAKESKLREKILLDREVCQYLWNHRKVITVPRDWYGTATQKKYFEKLTFQDVARSFCPLKVIKIRGKGETKDMRVVFDAKQEPYKIQFISKVNGHSPISCLFNKWKLSEIRRFLGGAWFEEYIYQQADELARTIKNPPEVKLNVRMSDREIDVVVAASKMVYLLECKTGHVDLDDIRRLEQLVQWHAAKKGIKTLGILVSLKPIQANDAVAQFIKQSNHLACIHGDNVPTRMKNLLTIQSKSFLS